MANENVNIQFNFEETINLNIIINISSKSSPSSSEKDHQISRSHNIVQEKDQENEKINDMDWTLEVEKMEIDPISFDTMEYDLEIDSMDFEMETENHY